MDSLLTLDQLITHLTKLRDSTKEKLGVVVTVGGINGDRFGVVKVNRIRQGVEMRVTEMKTSLAPTPEEISTTARELREGWDRVTEHHRRGLIERVGVNSGIKLCTTSFVRDIDSSILTEL